MGTAMIEEVEAELSAWVDANWDPDMTVADWWQRLAHAKWTQPMLPENAGGRGLSRKLTRTVMRTIVAKKVMGPPAGLGITLAAPTIAAHGTQDQIDEYIPPILEGRVAWCQLFSEPGAGSDLAGLQTRADSDGDEWIVNGQKVWTSEGQFADFGMLIARTDTELPKHQGITYFALPMDQEGVEVRPLREMTGRAYFNEVFMQDARTTDGARIGARGEGWRVANTTLMVERATIGAPTAGVAIALPGRLAGNLGRRAGDFAGSDGKKAVADKAFSQVWPGMTLLRRYMGLAADLGKADDKIMRNRLAELYSLLRISRFNLLRAKAGGSRTGGEANVAKLLDAELNRCFREVGTALAGADAMLAPADSAYGGRVQAITLTSPSASIYGGTDQVQRNIVGERVLGLPKDPGPAKETPFKDLPKNQ